MDTMDLHPNTDSFLRLSPFKGFWIRFVALLLDGILITMGVFIIFFVLTFTAGSLFGEDAAVGTFMILIVLFIFAMLLYKPLMEGSEYQGTFGKYLVCNNLAQINNVL